MTLGRGLSDSVLRTLLLAKPVLDTRHGSQCRVLVYLGHTYRQFVPAFASVLLLAAIRICRCCGYGAEC